MNFCLGRSSPAFSTQFYGLKPSGEDLERDLDAVRRHPPSLVIVRKGYRFKGNARILDAGLERDEVMAMYRQTTERADERIRGLVVIDVTEAFPLTSPAYDLGRSEEEVRAQWMERWRGLYRFG